MFLYDEDWSGAATLESRDSQKSAELSSRADARLRKQSQERAGAFLQAERLAGIINSAMDGVITVDENQRIILFNNAAETMFLCSGVEAIGQPISRFIPERFRAAPRDHISKFGESGLTRRYMGALGEIRGLRANGEEFLIEASISQVGAGGQNLCTVILRDITERKKMEEELRVLSGRLISVQDAERRRIARELHDDLNQRLAMLSIELHRLDQEIPKRQSALHSRVQDLRAKTQEISSEIQRLSYRLHPSRLDHLGLAAALKGLCNDLSEGQGLKIEFRHDGIPAAIPKEITLCIFRVAQESLQNVIKHSGAREALVVLEKTDQSIHLVVSDEGCGFDPESARNKEGLGLISMRERLRLVGGEISIHSQPSRGTRIDVWVP